MTPVPTPLHAMRDPSGLPPELEAKRRVIAKAYNDVAKLNLLIVMGLLLAVMFLVARLGHAAIYGLGVILPVEVAVMYYSVRRGDALCRKMDFLCPHCHRPLFEARSTAYLTGTCPKCRARVASDG